MEKLVLAYSGGLDTSVAIRWLKEKYNWEPESYLEIFKEKSKNPECAFFKGYIKGTADTDLGIDANVVETKCIAKGDPHCEFELSY